MAERMLNVEVVYAAADRQLLVCIEVSPGCTLRQAVLQSGLREQFPELDLANAALGIFGKVIAAPEAKVVEQGDRIEIYRPLLADPKDVRKRRAAQAAQRAKQAGTS